MHPLLSTLQHARSYSISLDNRYHNGFVYFLCGVLIVLSGCGANTRSGTTRPVSASQQRMARTPAASPAQTQAFSAAETLRRQEQDIAALNAFKEFVRQYPSSPLTAQALLALGELSRNLDQTVQAEGYYRSLIQNFPGSPHVPEAQLALGLIAYDSQDYDRSLVSLQQALPNLPDPNLRGQAHYHLGAIAHQQRRYSDAIEALKTAAETSTDTVLIQQAHSDVITLIQDQLTLADLQQLSQRYATTFPGGLVLFRLAEMYREERNTIEEMAALQQLTTAFPDHPNMPLAEIRLLALQSSLTTNPTKIGVLLPLTGEGQLAGQRTLWGIEFALSTLRALDPSFDLTIVPRDSQGDSTIANAALRSLVNDEHVIAVIGPLFSQVATEIAPLVDELGIPVISPYARDSEFPLLSPYAFRNSLTDAIQARFLAEYAIQVLNLKRFAILYPDEAYGNALKDMFIEHVIRLQGEVVAVAPYPQDTTDFRRPIKRIGGVDDQTMSDLTAGAENATIQLPTSALGRSDQATKPYDAIFLPGYYDSVGLIAPELAFYNITGVQLLGSDGWNSPELTTIGEQFVERAIFVDGFFANASASAVSAFVRQFNQRYGEPPALLAAQGYDTLQLLAQLLQSDITSRDALRDSLFQVRDYPGLSGLTTITPEGDSEKVPYLLTIRRGRITQLN